MSILLSGSTHVNPGPVDKCSAFRPPTLYSASAATSLSPPPGSASAVTSPPPPPPLPPSVATAAVAPPTPPPLHISSQETQTTIDWNDTIVLYDQYITLHKQHKGFCPNVFLPFRLNCLYLKRVYLKHTRMYM